MPEEMLYVFGRPVEELTREELIFALRKVSHQMKEEEQQQLHRDEQMWNLVGRQVL